MSESIITTLITIGGMLGVTCLGYVFASIQSARAAKLATDQATTQWERECARNNARTKAEEARYREEVAREDARRQEEYRRSDTRYQEEMRAKYLREFWAHVLSAVLGVTKLRRAHNAGHVLQPEEEPATCSALACAVALHSLPTIYPLASRFHLATVNLQTMLEEGDVLMVPFGSRSWRQSLRALEKEVARQTGVILEEDAGSDDAPDGEAASSKAV